jgi:hypothetical protein
MRDDTGRFNSEQRPATVCTCGDHAFARLTKWGVTFVSPQDAHFIENHSWYMSGSGRLWYALRGPVNKRIHLSRAILQCSDDLDADHENGNTLDNRRFNLRPLTREHNNRNRRTPWRGASGFFGVTLHKPSGLYWSYYWLDGANRSAGYFRSAIEAARARDAAVLKHIGAIQTLNFPQGDENGRDCISQAC